MSEGASGIAASSSDRWRFCRFGLLVTGEGEEVFIADMFKSLAASGHCFFEVIRRVRQRSPRTSPRRRIQVVGTAKAIPDLDAEEIGLPARKYLSRKETFVILLDDLECSRRAQAREVFRRYRNALDAILQSSDCQRRASVHFLVNMLEAYYFADSKAPNEVLDLRLSDCPGDVEEIRNPKEDLQRLVSGFDEKLHGEQIVRKLDLPHVLSRVDTCASLRTLFAWCAMAIGLPATDVWQLESGVQNMVTGPQLAALS